MALGLYATGLGLRDALRGEERAESQQGQDRQRRPQAVEARFGVRIDRGVGRLRADAGLVRARREGTGVR